MLLRSLNCDVCGHKRCGYKVAPMFAAPSLWLFSEHGRYSTFIVVKVRVEMSSPSHSFMTFHVSTPYSYQVFMLPS